MKKSTLDIAMLALLLAVAISAGSCSKGVDGVESTTVVATDDGVVEVDTLTIDATVTAKDATKRKLTLTSADGGKTTYKAPPEMVNFDQIEVGDSVTAVDVEKRKVTYELPDGTTKTVKVSKDVDLSQVVAGENLTVVIGTGLAMEVTTP